MSLFPNPAGCLGILLLLLSTSVCAQFTEPFSANTLDDWTASIDDVYVTDEFSYEGDHSLYLRSTPGNQGIHATYNEAENFGYGSYSMWFYTDGYYTDIGLRWMYQDVGNCYFVNGRPLDTDNPGLALVRRVDGVNVIHELVPPVFELNQWYQLRVDHCQAEISVYIDDVLQFTVIDDVPVTPGKLNVGGYAGPIHIDLVSYTPFDENCELIIECSTDGGMFQEPPLGICDGSLSLTNIGANADYSLIYLLADEDDYIVDVNTDGNFSNIPLGSFFPYCLNIAEEELPNDIAQLIDISLNDYLADKECYSLLVGETLPSVGPIVANIVEECQGENGLVDIIVSLDGGLPAVDGSLFQVEQDVSGEFAVGEEYIATYVDNQPYNFFIQDNIGCQLSISEPAVECVFLAIELLSLEGVAEENQNVIYWSTASEKDNALFELHRSFDGRSFDKIAEIEGAGNSSVINKYYHIDKVTENVCYYKLMSISFDGKKSQSEIITILRKNSALSEGKLYPNPVVDQLNFELNIPQNDWVSIAIISANGSILFQQEKRVAKGLWKESLSTKDFLKGQYILKIEGNHVRFSESFIIER